VAVLRLLRCIVVGNSSERGTTESVLASEEAAEQFLSLDKNFEIEPNQSFDVAILRQLLCLCRECDQSLPVTIMIDVATTFAENSKVGICEDIASVTWMSLQTVYAHKSVQVQGFGVPYLVRMAQNIVHENSMFGEQYNQEQLFLETIPSYVKRRGDGAGLRYHESIVLQLWGLVSCSADALAGHSHKLTSLIEAVETYIDSVAGASNDQEEKKEATERRRNLDKEQVQLPFLCADVLDDFFELLVNVAVGALVFVAPATQKVSANECGPYLHLHKALRVCRRVLETYRTRHAVFTGTVHASVARLSRLCLSSAVCQIHRCIDWRNQQTPLPWEKQVARVYDPGALVYLQRLLDAVLSLTSEMFTLCQSFQQDSHPLQVRSTGLRQVTERTVQSVEKVAFLHNLSLVKSAEDLPVVVAHSQVGETKGKATPTIHTNPTAPRGSESTPSDDNYESEISLEESSFGATGDWGVPGSDDSL